MTFFNHCIRPSFSLVTVIFSLLIINIYGQENDKVLLKNNPLNGVYEYTYEYNSKDLKENHYIEFKDGKAFYYGTSDDFDSAREGYYPGFFSTEIKDIIINGNQVYFKLTVKNSDIYKKVITPENQNNKNESWTIGLRHHTREYNGLILGDTITINTVDFDQRKFIKK